MTTLPLNGPRYHRTGQWRFRTVGSQVVLQVEEATRPMARPDRRWRDATPQDLADLVSVKIQCTTLTVAA